MSTTTTTVDIRSGDDEIHPQAIVREEEAIEDARAKRLRAWAGGMGVALCAVAFLTALWRDNTFVLGGSFLGVMVAGNVVPYTVIRDVIVLRFKGG
jgi:hypothetical protein